MNWKRTVSLALGWTAVAVLSWGAFRYPFPRKMDLSFPLPLVMTEWGLVLDYPRKTAPEFWMASFLWEQYPETAQRMSAGKYFDLEPVFQPITPLTPETGFDVLSDSYARREQTGEALTTFSPVVLTLHQPLYVGAWDTLRPVASVGVGVLRQSRVEGAKGEVDNELRTLLRLGLGAEWTPTEWMIFRMGYDYSHLPIKSSLNPDIPENDHAVSVGVEIKF